MNTILSLLILFISLTFGLGFIAIIMLIMGLFGAPGGILFELGRKSHNGVLSFSGFILTLFGQAFVICSYIVFVVSALRAVSAAIPNMPTWPLWIAAFFHSNAVPSFAMKEKPEIPSSQPMTLGFVAFISFICFLTMVYVPQWLLPIYSWIPFFQSNIR